MNPEPVATIDSISPNPATVSQTVTFRGHGTDDGEIVNYYWYANGELIGSGAEISHSFSSSKTYSIIFKVIDDDNADDQDTESLVINPSSGGDGDGPGENHKPVAVIDTISKTTAEYGEQIYFYGYGTDPDGDTITEFEWSSNIDGVINKNQSFYLSTLSVNNHIIRFKVKDNNNKWSDDDTEGIQIQLTDVENNKKPTAIGNGPYLGAINTLISFEGSASYDQDQDSINYKWDFGDGSKSTAMNTYHIYTEENLYEVSLTITDEHGLTDIYNTTATIYSQLNNDNTDPVADAGGPYEGVINTIIELDGSDSYDTDDEIVSYEWDFGDDSTGTTVNPQHIYREQGAYVIKLTVTDSKGATDFDTTSITISEESNNNDNNNNNNNNQNNNGEDNGDEDDDKLVIPGFEMIILIISLILVISYYKYKKKY